MSDASESDKTPLTLCPYCGHTQRGGERCEHCRGLFEPLSRKATQIAMGPWYLRDTANPFRPGFSYETLKQQIKAGRIKPLTILRGPTTRQFWSIARHMPGVAHLLGYCHACGEQVQPVAPNCPACGASFGEVPHRNELGLAYTTPLAAQRAQRELELEREGGAAPQSPPTPPEVTPEITPEIAPTAAPKPATSRVRPHQPTIPSQAIRPTAMPHTSAAMSQVANPLPRPTPPLSRVTPSAPAKTLDTPNAPSLGSMMIWLLVGLSVAAIVAAFIVLMWMTLNGGGGLV